MPMRKLAPLLSTAMLFSVLMTAVYAAEVEREFKIGLTGGAERPAPVVTQAFGSAEVELKDLLIKFEVEVCNIQGVTQSHIHVGSAAVAGPVIIFLYGFDPTGFSAEDCVRLSSGVRTPANLIPRPAQGINNWDDFVNAFMAGNTYVNVHTAAFPGGEIRGQLDLV